MYNINNSENTRESNVYLRDIRNFIAFFKENVVQNVYSTRAILQNGIQLYFLMSIPNFHKGLVIVKSFITFIQQYFNINICPPQ